MTRNLFFAAVLSLVMAAAGDAQGLGTINGTVTDASGAVIPSAVLRVTDESTGVARTVSANSQGFYVIPQLRPSTYTLTATQSGFQTYTQKGITLLADQSATVDVTLQVGTTTESVTVEAAAKQIDVTTPTLGQVVEQRRVVDLPLNGRNAATLTLLVAGAVNSPSGGADQGNTKTFPGAVTISTNGARQNEISYNLDGATYIDQYTDVNQPFPFPDALQEFSVETSNYSAKYGENQGGVVNVITKSGTNQYHGDGFEFVRNAVFNSRNFFAANRDQLKRNQFGGTIGGPVRVGPSWLRNTWFFGGVQATRIRTVSEGRSATVPTPANLNGDFSALLDPKNPGNPTGKTVVINDPQTGKPFPGNMITPTSRLDPASLALAKFLPVGQAQADGTVFFGVPSIRQNFYDVVGRVDHSIGSNDNLTGRYDFQRFTNGALFSPTNILIYADGSTIESQNGLLNWTHTIRSNILNEARFSVSRVASSRGPASGVPSAKDFGVNILLPPIQKAIQGIGVSGFFSFGDNPPALFGRNTFNWADDLTWVHGRHSIGLGIEVDRNQVNIDNFFLAPGDFRFTSDVTNYAVASFVLGKLRTFRQSNGDFENKRETNLGVYVLDHFRASRRLSLDFGLRYEPFWPIGFPRGDFAQFRPNDFFAGKHSSQFINAPAGLFFRGDPRVPRNATTGDFGNFAPRVGFAYDVFGDGKTSLRGGVGLFYASRVDTIRINRMEFITPFSTQVFFTDPTGPFSDPYRGSGVPSVILTPEPPTRDAAFPPPVLAVGFDPSTSFIVPLSYNWNLTLEHQLGQNWMVRVGYVGSHVSHIKESININPARFIPGSTLSTDKRRPFQGFTDIIQDGQDIDSNYTSLQVTLSKRFTGSLPLTLLANYTYSKSLDDQPFGGSVTDVGAESPSALPWNFPGRHQFDYGPSDFNHTHRFVASYIWELPRLAGAPRAARAVFGNWDLTGILSLQSGGPLTILAGKDQSQTGLGRDRAVITGPALGPGACKNTAPCVDYLNRNSFALPAAGTFGNVGKGSLTGPNLVNWDMGFFKNIPLRDERVRLQFRAEFFNIFNRANFNDPGTNFSSGSFGRIQGAGDPRIGQLALKIFF